MSDDELKRLREQARGDRKLMQQAADTLAEIDRNQGLIDRHVEVLTALRIRIEGKERASLEDLLDHHERCQRQEGSDRRPGRRFGQQVGLADDRGQEEGLAG